MRLSCEPFNKQRFFRSPFPGFRHTEESAMNLYHGLLFQSGHIADAKLAISLARSPESSPSTAGRPSTRSSVSARLHWLLEELVLLGGRPVSKDRNDDLNDPFPPLHPTH
jgi:hypothetical protein